MGQRREEGRDSLRVGLEVKMPRWCLQLPKQQNVFCHNCHCSSWSPPPPVLFVIWSMAQLWIESPSKWNPRVSIFFPDSDFFGKCNQIWSTMMFFFPLHLIVPHIHCVIWESSWVLLYTLHTYMIKSPQAKWGFSSCLWWWLLNQNRSCNWNIRPMEPMAFSPNSFIFV